MFDWSDVLIGALPGKALVALLIAALYVIVIGGTIYFFFLR